MTQSTNLSKNPSFDTRDTREPSYWKVNNAKKTKGTFENYEKNELQRKNPPFKTKVTRPPPSNAIRTENHDDFKLIICEVRPFSSWYHTGNPVEKTKKGETSKTPHTTQNYTQRITPQNSALANPFSSSYQPWWNNIACVLHLIVGTSEMLSDCLLLLLFKYHQPCWKIVTIGEDK